VLSPRRRLMYLSHCLCPPLSLSLYLSLNLPLPILVSPRPCLHICRQLHAPNVGSCQRETSGLGV
jgi:hypothetical protein